MIYQFENTHPIQAAKILDFELVLVVVKADHRMALVYTPGLERQQVHN
jgi:hypothetical protein